MATQPPSGEADEFRPDQKIEEQSDTLVAETKKLAEEMHQRCRVLLDELLQFQAHLKALKKEARVEVRYFKGGVQSELRILGKVKKAMFLGSGSGVLTRHRSSCNRIRRIRKQHTGFDLPIFHFTGWCGR
jgi:hypothetical protein